VLRALLGYVIVLAAAAALLQVYSPFPVLTWLENWGKVWVGPWLPTH
jgi:hypothetical protein